MVGTGPFSRAVVTSSQSWHSPQTLCTPSHVSPKHPTKTHLVAPIDSRCARNTINNPTPPDPSPRTSTVNQPYQRHSYSQLTSLQFHAMQCAVKKSGCDRCSPNQVIRACFSKFAAELSGAVGLPRAGRRQAGITWQRRAPCFLPADGYVRGARTPALTSLNRHTNTSPR